MTAGSGMGHGRSPQFYPMRTPITVVGADFDRVFGMAKILFDAQPGSHFIRSVYLSGRARRGYTEKQAAAIKKAYQGWVRDGRKRMGRR